MGSSKQLILFGFLAYLVLLTPISGMARCDEIRWFTDYPTAVRAKQKNRLILLDVYRIHAAMHDEWMRSSTATQP